MTYWGKGAKHGLGTEIVTLKSITFSLWNTNTPYPCSKTEYWKQKSNFEFLLLSLVNLAMNLPFRLWKSSAKVISLEQKEQKFILSP